MVGSPVPRVRGFGAELVAVHDELRAHLRRLRAAPADPGNRDRDLRAHCAAFCTALTTHHTSEDARTFPVLADEVPELRPVIVKLREDHVLIAGLLERVRDLTDRLPAEPGAEEILRFEQELDGLAAIMESHFAFEERRVTAALDQLERAEHTAVELFGIEPVDPQRPV
jgi:iron-sulfur cluster repair protein YtfE (RIC family)